MSKPAEAAYVVYVLNGAYGGFELSDAAVKHLKSLGWGTCVCARGPYCHCAFAPNIDRSHPLLLQTVDALGIKACGQDLYLARVPVPPELPIEAIRAACDIHEYDGAEGLQFRPAAVLEWMVDHDRVTSVVHAKQILAWARQCEVSEDYN